MSLGCLIIFGRTKSRSVNELRGLWQARTTIAILGRLFPAFLNMLPTFGKCSFEWISRRTRAVKVAVTAITGVLQGKNAHTIPSNEYCFRKSAPQCETQCPSSTNNERTCWVKVWLQSKRFTNVRDWSILGETRIILYFPSSMAWVNDDSKLDASMKSENWDYCTLMALGDKPPFLLCIAIAVSPKSVSKVLTCSRQKSVQHHQQRSWAGYNNWMCLCWWVFLSQASTDILGEQDVQRMVQGREWYTAGLVKFPQPHAQWRSRAATVPQQIERLWLSRQDGNINQTATWIVRTAQSDIFWLF